MDGVVRSFWFDYAWIHVCWLRRKLFCCKSKASFPNRSCRPGCVVDALSVVGDLEFQDILGQTSITDESELTCSSIGVSVYLSFGKRVAPNDASFRSDSKVSQDPAQDVNSQETWTPGGSRQHSMLHVAACLLPQSPTFGSCFFNFSCISV